MGMPIKTFWMLNQNVDRLLAQRDMRSLTVAVSGQSSQESFDSCRKALILEVGTIVKMEENPIRDAVRDEEGFAELKEMALQTL